MRKCEHMDVPRGGKRKNAGRPSLPDSKRRANATIKMLPATSKGLAALADRGNTSQGGVIEWFVLAPEAADARKLCKEKAFLFDGTLKSV